LDRIFEFFDTESTIQEKPHAKVLENVNGVIESYEEMETKHQKQDHQEDVLAYHRYKPII